MGDAKTDLREYLQQGRDTLVWKLEGLGEYDARRPLTPTGTNLLGLVRHLTGVEGGYLGLVFGRPLPGGLPIDGLEDDPHVDMWVPAEQSREDVVGAYRRAQAHADATIAALALDDVGTVPHWPADRASITLHRALVHVATETHRHAGQVDILREGIDGAVGHRQGTSSMGEEPHGDWARHVARVEEAARRAAGRDLPSS